MPSKSRRIVFSLTPYLTASCARSACPPHNRLSPVFWSRRIPPSKRRPQSLHLYRCVRPLRPFLTTFVDPQKKHFFNHISENLYKDMDFNPLQRFHHPKCPPRRTCGTFSTKTPPPQWQGLTWQGGTIEWKHLGTMALARSSRPLRTITIPSSTTSTAG